MEAVSILAAEGRDVHLDLVGGGLTVIDKAYGEKVSERAKRPDIAARVRLLGSVPYRDVARLYANATIVVNASTTGSVDKVVLEGMAARRPILSCNEAIPPVLREFGADARHFSFAPGDARDLAAKIAWWLERTESERAAWGERLRAIVARDHEVEALMRRLVALMGGDA
jgi:glycosyltransferase involved in cell wall biosynthesis